MSSHHREIDAPVLIGDIGGTNARFAIVPDATGPVLEFPIVQTKDFETIDAAIAGTVLRTSPVKPRSAILALAGPVDGDEVKLTNCPWVVRPRTMIAGLGFRDVVLLNDFEAQALAVIALGSQHLEKIGGGEVEKDAPRVVLGPGTGLGVAGLIHSAGKWIPVPGEGGHMDLGPRSARDFEVFPHIEKLDGRISGEQILCGRGLVNLYRAVAAADGIEARYSLPSEITNAGLAKSDPAAQEALSLFVTYLGRTAGDVALVFKSQGGVYLSGGIAQKIIPALKDGAFREAFDDKAPHRSWMSEIPIYVMTHPLAALEGLAAYARNQAAFGVETRGRRWMAQPS
ncbi:MAG: glucokinase [Rhizobiaceae bacterium]|nr:glucokinase [Rhizobiaceae bacterium]